MLTKIERKTCFKNFPKFPKANYRKEEFYFPEIIESHTLTLKAKTLKGHIKSLANEITCLAEKFNFDSLIFLGDEKIPWLFQKNEYKPVKEALQFLKKNKVEQNFDGALQIELASLPDFLKHFCWLVRCNASLPYFHFMDKGQNVICEICKYCNLHLYPLNTFTNKTLKRLIKYTAFESLKDQICYEQYFKKSAITGRQIIV